MSEKAAIKILEEILIQIIINIIVVKIITGISMKIPKTVTIDGEELIKTRETNKY
jgi:uncharacterized membrane protein (DUF106 family)